MNLLDLIQSKYLLVIGIGMVVGALAYWIAARSRFLARLSASELKNQSQIAVLSETIRNQSDELNEVRSQLERTNEELKSSNEQILSVSQERAAALSKLEYMSSLESSLEKSKNEIADLNSEITVLKAHAAELEIIIRKERQSAEEKIGLLEDIKGSMTDTYKAISANALEKNNQAFLDLANTTFSKYLESAKTDFDLRSKSVKDVVLPVKEALEKYDEYVRSVELEREKAYGGLSEQVVSLAKTQNDLHKETGRLVKAMRVPHVRGRWGEITLKRVAEMAGMENRCDFFEQPTSPSDNRTLRPDMIVSLPGNRRIVVDAKVPIVAYLDALEAETDKKREELLSRHARHVQNHILQLAQKTYWAQFQPSPEFVLLFIPGENFFSAALSQNPGLIEFGIERGVILATPTTLITLLKTISYAWRQEAMAENAKIISELGSELYERLNVMAKHINRLGREIDRCAATYNQVVGSFERRVFSAARKFNELGVNLKSDKELLIIDPVETKTREISNDESN